MASSIVSGEGAIIPPTRPDFDVVLQAMKDLLEFSIIWESLQPSPSNTLLWSKLREMFGDNAARKDASKNQLARNTQFELLNLAMFQRAGCEPQLLPTGPEFRCRLGSVEFSVECKRVLSLDQMSKRLREGARQIKRGGGPGFLMIDYSWAVNPSDNLLLLNGRPQDFERKQRERFTLFWRDHGSDLEKTLVTKGVLGIGLFDYLFVQEGGNKESGVGRWLTYFIRDFRRFTCQRDEHIRLARNVFDFLTVLGLPAPNESPVPSRP